jgi:UDP-glucose 4-epimerase
MQRIGITGASGFLGSVLLPRLAARGVRVKALTRTVSPALAHDPAVEWMQGDLLSYGDCTRFVTDVDTIVHLAHTNTPLTSTNDLPGDAATNIVPTATLLQAIRDAGTAPHLVYASTGGALYADDGRHEPFTEESPVEPATSYGIQKLTAEHYLRLGAAEGWFTATVLRIGNPYGILLPAERRQSFIGVALARLLERQPVQIFGDPRNVRDYVHLDDVMRMVERSVRGARGWTVYNVGSGEGHSVLDVLELLQAYVGVEADVRYEAESPDARRLPPWVVLDVGKAERELGWVPEIAFAAGLRTLCDDAMAAA